MNVKFFNTVHGAIYEHLRLEILQLDFQKHMYLTNENRDALHFVDESVRASAEDQSQLCKQIHSYSPPVTRSLYYTVIARTEKFLEHNSMKHL